jgi:hypothetical protein
MRHIGIDLSVVRKVSGYYLPCPFDQVSWAQKTWASSKAEAALAWRIPDASGYAGFGTFNSLAPTIRFSLSILLLLQLLSIIATPPVLFLPVKFLAYFEHQLYAINDLSSDSHHSKSSSLKGNIFRSLTVSSR